jgi:hypothetical protein
MGKAEKISEWEKGIELKRERFRDRRKKRKLQKKELRKISNFFIFANLVVLAGVLVVGVIEHFYPNNNHYIITDKVMVAAIAGVTIQSGAIILAAFKGLFSGK